MDPRWITTQKTYKVPPRVGVHSGTLQFHGEVIETDSRLFLKELTQTQIAAEVYRTTWLNSKLKIDSEMGGHEAEWNVRCVRNEWIKSFAMASKLRPTSGFTRTHMAEQDTVWTSTNYGGNAQKIP
jgi:hypothetical protein